MWVNASKWLTRTHFAKPNQPAVIAKGAHPHLSLRGAQRRGNLVEVEHTSANHHYYGDEIATPVSSTGRNDRLKRLRVSPKRMQTAGNGSKFGALLHHSGATLPDPVSTGSN